MRSRGAGIDESVALFYLPVQASFRTINTLDVS